MEILSAPLKVQISKFSELYVVGTLNLCLGMPGTMQKESAQSDQPARRKRPKCDQILPFRVNVKMSQYICKLWKFSRTG